MIDETTRAALWADICNDPDQIVNQLAERYGCFGKTVLRTLIAYWQDRAERAAEASVRNSCRPRIGDDIRSRRPSFLQY